MLYPKAFVYLSYHNASRVFKPEQSTLKLKVNGWGVKTLRTHCTESDEDFV